MGDFEPSKAGVPASKPLPEGSAGSLPIPTRFSTMLAFAKPIADVAAELHGNTYGRWLEAACITQLAKQYSGARSMPIVKTNKMPLGLCPIADRRMFFGHGSITCSYLVLTTLRKLRPSFCSTLQF